MLHPYAFNGKNNYFSPGKNMYSSGSINQSKASKQPISFKGFNAPVSLPNGYFDDCWLKLNQALETILTSSQPPEDLQNLYQLCQILCRNNLGEKIYQQLEQVFETSSRQRLQISLSNFNSQDFLSEFNREWKAYQQQIKIINIIFSYLDQTQIRKTPQLMPLSKLALHKFNEVLQNDLNCKEKINQSLILAIFQLKSGKHMDREPIRNLLEMLILLNIYQNTFEDELLFHTRQFYQAQAIERLSQLTLKEYIGYVENILEQERDFITNYLQGQTEKPIMNILFTELIKNYGGQIVNNPGFNSLFEDYDYHLMQNIYSLYKHVGIVETLQNVLCESITSHANVIIQNISNDLLAIHKLVWLNNICMKYLTQAMEHNPNIYDSIKKCFSKSFNDKSIIIAQKLCFYFHHFLTNPEAVSPNLLPEQIIQNGIQIFRLNESKDVFEDLYRHQLSNRLITNGTIHMDLEKSMVSHLREVSNLDFTHNLEGMLRDINTSQDLTSRFNESSNLGNIQSDFRIFSSYHWPSHNNIDFLLPNQLSQLQKNFEQFYTNKYADKKLSWSHTLGTCEIFANFPSGTKEFTINCFQASILLLFDELDRDELRYSEIIQHTKIPPKELNISLESLYNRSIPILKCDILNSPLETCSFSINHNFTHEFNSIRINDMKALQTTPIESEIKQKTFLDRQYQVDSVLIRMMKSITKCKINLLETELNRTLTFNITKPQFDQRIQYLIDKGYLEFSEEDPSTIIYIP